MRWGVTGLIKHDAFECRTIAVAQDDGRVGSWACEQKAYREARPEEGAALNLIQVDVIATDQTAVELLGTANNQLNQFYNPILHNEPEPVAEEDELFAQCWLPS